MEAQYDEEEEQVSLKVVSGCESIQKMMEEVGSTFDSIDLCIKKPGLDAFHAYASAHFPPHAACPVLAGILKCAEAESGLALPRDVSFTFEE